MVSIRNTRHIGNRVCDVIRNQEAILEITEDSAEMLKDEVEMFVAYEKAREIEFREVLDKREWQSYFIQQPPEKKKGGRKPGPKKKTGQTDSQTL